MKKLSFLFKACSDDGGSYKKEKNQEVATNKKVQEMPVGKPLVTKAGCVWVTRLE